MDLPQAKRATEAHFYKYSGLQDADHVAWLKALIFENQIYLPTLTQLNDPADGIPVLKPLSEDKMFEFLYQHRRDPNWTLEQEISEMLTLRYNIQLHGVELLHRQMTDLLRKELETYRIYSMSKRFNNMAMWAKYADEHLSKTENAEPPDEDYIDVDYWADCLLRYSFEFRTSRIESISVRSVKAIHHRGFC